jgi:hypothetical protein
MNRISGALVLVLVAAGCSAGGHSARGASSTTTTSVVTAAAPTPKAAALALQQRLLDDTLLPPTTHRTSAPEPRALAGFVPHEAVGNLLYAHRDFRVDQTPYDLWHWVQAHIPRGFRSGGQSAGSIGTEHTFGVDNELAVLPLNISYAELSLRIAGPKPGPAYVRVDAKVAWTRPRSASELVSPRDRVLIASTIHENEPGKPVGKHVLVTDPKLMRPIVKAFNDTRLEAAPDPFGGFRECGPGGLHDIEYRLEFAPSPTAKPDIVATLSCGLMTVTVNGHPAPLLQSLPDATWKQLRKLMGIAEPTV